MFLVYQGLSQIVYKILCARMPGPMAKVKKHAARSDANPVENPLKKEDDLAPTPASHEVVIRTRSRRTVQSKRHSDFDYNFSQCDAQIHYQCRLSQKNCRSLFIRTIFILFHLILHSVLLISTLNMLCGNLGMLSFRSLRSAFKKFELPDKSRRFQEMSLGATSSSRRSRGRYFD